jgi:cytoskeletal protein CcmA (bactofilin family)
MNKTLRSVFQNSRPAEALQPDPEVDVEGTEVSNAESPNSNSRPLIVLGKTLFLKGDLAADEDLVLHGRVEGSITHTENLTIGVDGMVIGDIQARVITIKGTVEGDVSASESVVIAPSAVVTGDVIAPRINLVEGAKFNGAVRMPSPATSEVADEISLSQGLDGDFVISGRDVERLLRRR